MAWLAVDKDDDEYIYGYKPHRIYTFWIGKQLVELPEGTIKKIIGRELTWEDEPVEI